MKYLLAMTIFVVGMTSIASAQTMGQMMEWGIAHGRTDPSTRQKLPDQHMTPAQWKAAHPFLYALAPADAQRDIDAAIARQSRGGQPRGRVLIKQ